jgi:phage-related protein
MKHENYVAHYGFILLTCGALVFGLTPTRAQSQNQAQNMAPQTQDRDDATRRQLASFDNFLDSHPEVAEQLRKDPSLINDREFVEGRGDLKQYLQEHPEVREELSQNPNRFMRQEERFDRREDHGRDNDVTRHELAEMDRFMDSHPEIAEQLRKDPSLVNNKQFVQNHPELQKFLADHPGVREEYKENPNAFMHREERFDRREDRARDRDVTQGELANMDRFLDSHPEIAERLRKDPRLIDNKEFVTNHPALQSFLADHPGVREQFKEHPYGFMRDEERYDRREARDQDSNVNRQELATMDRFLDSHPEVAEQLRKDPGLVDNKQFVANHPALQSFLTEHQTIAQLYREHPDAFMRAEDRFDRNGDSAMRGDRDGTRASFNEFLGSHDRIADELSKNPSLANNRDYLEARPELKDYLQAHPQVHEELSENPQTFLQSTQQFNAHSTAKVDSESKPK